MVVSADKQVKGKGQYDSEWLSPYGSLSVSFAFSSKPSHLNLFPLIFARHTQTFINRFLSNTIEDFSEKNGAKLKFKNDVFLDEKKLSGILCQSHFIDEGKPMVVVGIGVNVNNDFKNNSNFSKKFISLRD